MPTPARHLALARPFPTATAESLRVAVIARDRRSRAGLAALLHTYDDLIVDELDADDLLHSRLRVLDPDVLLCDRDASSDLRRLDPPAVALLDDAALAAEALAGGARGVLLRDAEPRRIHAALFAAASGTIVIDDALAAAVLQKIKPQRQIAEPLTARELEVMHLLASGLTNKEIARSLHVTDHTVKFHVNGILGKLGVATRTEAVVQAARLGIVVL